MADGALEQNPERVFKQLSGDDPLFRLITKKKYLEPGRLSEAFLLATNETGLSVCYDCIAHQVQAIANLDSEGYASLTMAALPLSF